MQIGYYKFKDGSDVTLRYGVSEEGEPDAIVEDLYDPAYGRWRNYAEVSRYVLFEYSQIEAITLDEAQKRTDGRAGDDADGVIPTKPPVFSGPYLD
jgi:hypothetical protein